MVGDMDGPRTDLKTHHSPRNKIYSIERKYEMDAVRNDNKYHVKYSIGEASRGNVKEGEAESLGLEARKDLLWMEII